MENNGIWQQSYPIHAFMVNQHQKVDLVTIANLLQDTARHHAHAHDFGFNSMKARRRFWVLNRLTIDMQTLPDWQDTVLVNTWVQSIRGPMSFRNFELHNKQGEIIGSAATLWVLLDFDKKRPVRITKTSTFTFVPDKPVACGLPTKLKALPLNTSPNKHIVQYSDLDVANHVNNAKYIEWLFNQTALNASEKDYHHLEINYTKETLLGDNIHIRMQAQESNPTIFNAVITKTADESAVCCAKIY